MILFTDNNLRSLNIVQKHGVTKPFHIFQFSTYTLHDTRVGNDYYLLKLLHVWYNKNHNTIS